MTNQTRVEPLADAAWRRGSLGANVVELQLLLSLIPLSLMLRLFLAARFSMDRLAEAGFDAATRQALVEAAVLGLVLTLLLGACALGIGLRRSRIGLIVALGLFGWQAMQTGGPPPLLGPAAKV